MDDLVLRALTDGDAAAFRKAVEEGHDVNVASDFGGSVRTPLHHAAAAGDLPTVQYLVEHGADLGAVDPEYQATPLGWSEFFDKPEVAAYLRLLPTVSERVCGAGWLLCPVTAVSGSYGAQRRWRAPTVS